MCTVFHKKKYLTTQFSEDFQTKMDQSSLRSLAECPVCYDVRRDVPIYQCANGHIICGACKDRETVAICPTCRCPFDNPPRRNRQVGKMILDEYVQGGLLILS